MQGYHAIVIKHAHPPFSSCSVIDRRNLRNIQTPLLPNIPFFDKFCCLNDKDRFCYDIVAKTIIKKSIAKCICGWKIFHWTLDSGLCSERINWLGCHSIWSFYAYAKKSGWWTLKKSIDSIISWLSSHYEKANIIGCVSDSSHVYFELSSRCVPRNSKENPKLLGQVFIFST
jgi:hypothetical protein